jgi:hypothetical protein
MADNIWSSIEMQLDVVEYAPDNTSSPKKATKGKGWYGAAGATTVAVAVSLWLFTSPKDDAPEKTTRGTPLPAIEIPIAVPDSSTSDEPVDIKPFVPVNSDKDTMSIIPIPPAAPDFDSTTREILPAVKPDSQAVTNYRAFPLIVDSVSLLPRKKSRGVKGITEDDYRLSVEDSTQKPQ